MVGQAEPASSADLQCAAAWPPCRPPERPCRQFSVTVPVADPAVEKTRQRIVVQGEVPSALRPPPGCRFHTRCPLAFERCRSDDPPLADLGQGRSVACHLHPAGSTAAAAAAAAAPAAAPALATAG